MNKNKYNNLLKLRINFDLLLFFIILFSSSYLVTICFYSYENFNYSSDLFHHYSVIRNIHEGLGPYEGPKYQYMFGNHTYLIYYLISPLLYLYKDPKILLLINILAIFSSSYLIYLISKKIMGNLDKKNFISFLIAISFLIYPTIFKGYFYPTYGFQPDTLATPLFLCIFLFILQNRITLTIIFLLLFLSVKEEFILILPALIIFTVIIQKLFNLGGITWNIKNSSLIIIPYILFSTLIIFILLTAISLNDSLVYLPAFWNQSAFSAEIIYLSFYKVIKIVTPGLILILMIYFLSGFERKILILILLLFFSTLLRVFENAYIYGLPDGTAWGNLIIGPIHFVIFIVALRFFYENYNRNSYLLFIGFLSYLSLSMINIYASQLIVNNSSVIDSIKFYNSKSPLFEITSETKKLDSLMVKKAEYDYFITNEYVIHPFTKMSHVSIEWLEIEFNRKGDDLTRNNIISNASYILILKQKKNLFPEKKIYEDIPSKDFIKLLQARKTIIYESDLFLLLN